MRGPWYKRPKVHSGFDKAWRNNGFNQRVMIKIEDLFNTGEVDRETCRILVTGKTYIIKQSLPL